MKLLISLFFLIIIFSSNLHASEYSRDNFIKKSNENTQDITPKLSNEQLQELIKKLPRENSVTQSKPNEDWFKKLRPFIVPLIIVLYLIFGCVLVYITYNQSFWLIDNGNSGFVTTNLNIDGISISNRKVIHLWQRRM